MLYLADSGGKVDKSLEHLLDGSSHYTPVFLWPERGPCLYAPSFSMGLIVTFIVVVLETYESLKILTQSSEVKMISVKLSVIWAGLFHSITLLSNSK